MLTFILNLIGRELNTKCKLLSRGERVSNQYLRNNKIQY